MHVHMHKLLVSSVDSIESSSIHDMSDYHKKGELLENEFDGTVVTRSFLRWPRRAIPNRMRLIYFQNDISNLVISKLDISKVDISKVDIWYVRAHARHGRKLCHVIGMAHHVTHSLRSSGP